MLRATQADRIPVNLLVQPKGEGIRGWLAGFGAMRWKASFSSGTTGVDAGIGCFCMTASADCCHSVACSLLLSCLDDVSPCPSLRSAFCQMILVRARARAHTDTLLPYSALALVDVHVLEESRRMFLLFVNFSPTKS